jgi:hypothetical protein
VKAAPRCLDCLCAWLLDTWSHPAACRLSLPLKTHTQAEVALLIIAACERRNAALEAQRNALLNHLCGSDPPGGADGTQLGQAAPAAAAPAGGRAHFDALQQLSRVRSAMMFNFVAHILALFDGVMCIEQYGKYCLAAFPRTLTMPQVRIALTQQVEARRAAAAGDTGGA